MAWERWGVLGILGIGLLGQFISHMAGEGSVVATALSLLMFAGIYTRSTWGWWLTNILCGLNTLLLLAFGSMLTGGEGVVLYASAFANGLIIALLILSRLRGSYD